MATEKLDTPIAAYGMPVVLFPDVDVLTAYTRVSPSSTLPAAAVDAWWETQPVQQVPLVPRPAAERVDLDGAWAPDPDLVRAKVPADAAGLWSAQVAVNAAHVAALVAAAADAGRWPPVRVLRTHGTGWLMDGVHRTCALLTAGTPTVAARVVDAERVTTCPCGWAGAAGGLLTHPCPTRSG